MKEKEVNNKTAKILFKNKTKIIVTTLVFALLSVVVTYFIPKKYVAFGVVYPTNSNNISDVVKNPDFGFDIHADRLIQLFESQPVKQKIINEFNLIEYYEIDTNSAGWRYTLNKNYSTDISFSRTRYLSVVIEAKMKDSHLAANIVNRLIDIIDEVREDLFKENINALLTKYESKINQQEELTNNLLQKIYNESNNQQTNKRLANNKLLQIEERQKSGEILKGDELIKEAININYSVQKEILINNYYKELGVLNHLNAEYLTIKEKTELPFPSIYKLIPAEADEKKVSPSYIVNIIIAVVLGLIFSIAMVIIPTRVKEITAQLND